MGWRYSSTSIIKLCNSGVRVCQPINTGAAYPPAYVLFSRIFSRAVLKSWVFMLHLDIKNHSSVARGRQCSFPIYCNCWHLHLESWVVKLRCLGQMKQGLLLNDIAAFSPCLCLVISLAVTLKEPCLQDAGANTWKRTSENIGTVVQNYGLPWVLEI